jgi:hypothetical protein
MKGCRRLCQSWSSLDWLDYCSMCTFFSQINFFNLKVVNGPLKSEHQVPIDFTITLVLILINQVKISHN